MEIKITIDEDKITQIVEQLVAEEMVSKHSTIHREATYGVRQGVEKAVKEYVYSQKDDIVEKCVTRATAELVRKGLPKLLDATAELVRKGLPRLLEMVVEEHDQARGEGGQA